jgi:hypothetical protein
VNGLESFTRTYEEYGMEQTSIEIAVLAYDKTHGKFSNPGDSGSSILTRDGRIVGILTGGAGPPTRPTSRTSARTGGLRRRLRTNTLAASSTRLSSRYCFPYPHHYAISFLFSSCLFLSYSLFPPFRRACLIVDADIVDRNYRLFILLFLF